MLIVWEVFADQGSSTSQQLLKMHALNPFIRCSSRRELLKVTRGSLAPEKLLTILFSTSLDKAFFLNPQPSSRCISSKTLMGKFLVVFQHKRSLWHWWSLIATNFPMIEVTWQYKTDGGLCRFKLKRNNAICPFSSTGFFSSFHFPRVHSSCEKLFRMDRIPCYTASHKKELPCP